MKKVVFYSNKKFPEELNYNQDRFSVDVLIWVETEKIHTIGWFDFTLMRWEFLNNEEYSEFVWRYFEDEIDKLKIKKSNKK